MALASNTQRWTLGSFSASGPRIAALVVVSLVFVLPSGANDVCKVQEPAAASTAAPPEQKPTRFVDADEIVRLARKGTPVQVDGAVIRGRLDFSYMTIEQQVKLTNCDFLEAPNLSYSTFKRHLILTGSTFRKGANFESATVDLNAALNRTQFLAGEANLRDLQVHGFLNMHLARFADGVVLRGVGAHLQKGADFSNDDFGGEARLDSMESDGDLNFAYAKFHKLFLLTTTKVSGSLFLRCAEFWDSATMPGIQVTYNVRSEGADFKNAANFSESQIGSFVELSGAKFENADKPVDFSRATVAAGGFFDRVNFAGEVKFNGAHFNSDASFDQATFERTASFERAHFDQGAHFEHTAFRGNASFHDTSFGTLDLSPDGQVDGEEQFRGTVELRGCTYDRVLADWQSLLSLADGRPRLAQTDKQPYLQLQKSYAAMGDDVSANHVFLEWHRVKRSDLFHSHKLLWLLDCVPWLTSNYGVAPGRLLEMSFLLIFVGMFIFSCPGAVSPVGAKDQAAAFPTKLGRLRHWDAAAVSLHQFLPIEVPFGAQWTPASQIVTLRYRHHDRGRTLLRVRPSTYATILKVSGYILVPLEIVVLNGLLKPGG